MKLKRISAAVGVGSLIAMGGIFAAALPASAHTPVITGEASCQTDGTYSIDWTVSTTNVPGDQTATITNAAAVPNGQWPDGVPTSIQGNTSIKVTETGIPGSSTSAKVSATFTWPDYQQDASGIVNLGGDCTVTPPPATTVTPPQITATAGVAVCTDGVSTGTNGTINLPAFEGGHWAEHDAGTISDVPPGDYTFTAVADDGYTLAPVDGLDPSQWGLRFVTVPASTPIDCTPPYVPPVPTQCIDATTLPTSTDVDPRGWGDLYNAKYVADGIQLDATATDAAYAYVDLDPGFKLSDIGTLTADGTGDYAFILQAPDSTKWNVHYEADGTWWTTQPGLFTDGGPGYYHASDLSNLQADPLVTEVAVWVNPGHSALIHSVTFNCQTQPFAAQPSDNGGTTPPDNGGSTPTDTSKPAPAVVDTVQPAAVLADTGSDIAGAITAASVAGISLLAGVSILTIVLLRHRRETAGK